MTEKSQPAAISRPSGSYGPHSVNEGARLTAWGRRVRAALALSGRSIDDVVPELNISRKTLERAMRGERTPREWETRRLAELLDIPEWFLREGLDGHAEAADREAQLAAQLDRVAQLADRFEHLEGTLTGIAADVAEIKRRQDGGI